MDKKEVCNGRINQFGLCNKCCQPSQGTSAYCNRMIPSPIVSDQEKEHDCTDYAKINCTCPVGLCARNTESLLNKVDAYANIIESRNATIKEYWSKIQELQMELRGLKGV